MERGIQMEYSRGLFVNPLALANGIKFILEIKYFPLYVQVIDNHENNKN